MTFFKSVALISGVSAGLCVAALPLWAMGVPGVENQYAKGWKMGLTVLLIYPLAWLINYAPYFFLRNRLHEANRGRWQMMVSVLAGLIWLLALLRLVQAFKTMR